MFTLDRLRHNIENAEIIRTRRYYVPGALRSIQRRNRDNWKHSLAYIRVIRRSYIYSRLIFLFIDNSETKIKIALIATK